MILWFGESVPRERWGDDPNQIIGLPQTEAEIGAGLIERVELREDGRLAVEAE